MTDPVLKFVPTYRAVGLREVARFIGRNGPTLPELKLRLDELAAAGEVEIERNRSRAGRNYPARYRRVRR